MDRAISRVASRIRVPSHSILLGDPVTVTPVLIDEYGITITPRLLSAVVTQAGEVILEATYGEDIEWAGEEFCWTPTTEGEYTVTIELDWVGTGTQSLSRTETSRFVVS